MPKWKKIVRVTIYVISCLFLLLGKYLIEHISSYIWFPLMVVFLIYIRYVYENGIFDQRKPGRLRDFSKSDEQKRLLFTVYLDRLLVQEPIAKFKLYSSLDFEIHVKTFENLAQTFIADFFKNRPILAAYNGVSEEALSKIKDNPKALKVYNQGDGSIKVLLKDTEDVFYFYSIVKDEEVTHQCNLAFDVFMELITDMTDDEEIIKAADEGKQPKFRVEHILEIRKEIRFTIDEKYAQELKAFVESYVEKKGFNRVIEGEKKGKEDGADAEVRMTIDATNSVFPKPIVEVNLKTRTYFDQHRELLNEISYRVFKNIIGTLPIILEVDGKISKYGSVAYDIENRDKKIIGGYRDADGETICYILDFQRELVSQKYAPYCFKVYPEVDISGMSDEEITECYRSGQALGLPFKAWSNGNGEVIMTFDGRYLEDVKGIVKSAVGELRVKGEITTKHAE